MLQNPPSLLIIGTVWPEPNSSAAGSRMLQLIKSFQSQGWQITFASSAGNSEYAFNLNEIGISTVSVEINSSNFDTFIQQLNPDIVLFDRFITEEQFGWRVAKHCPNALRIVDTEDLHCLRAARQKAVKEKHPFTFNDLMLDITKREIASILRSDLSLIISEFEMILLKKQFKVDTRLLHYFPFIVNPIKQKTITHWLPFESRHHFVTIGNFLHDPNWDSVLYLKGAIWPLVRKQLPTAEMHVYGAYASQKALNLHQPKEGFYIKGRAQDAKKVMGEAKVCLAPLRFGAGLKGKFIDAMECGTPCVTTDIGAEAMHGELNWNGIIANNPTEIANAAVKLYTDQSLWETAQQNGVIIINKRFSKIAAGKQLVRKLLLLHRDIEQHRSNNFVGSMLMHHTLHSTKYMSKWIEAKNQLPQAIPATPLINPEQ